MTTATGVVIHTEELTKVYPGDIRAVIDLNLDVNEGEIFGLLGPNGAGKTTTVGMLTTRVIPTEGRASLGGVDVVARPSEAKPRPWRCRSCRSSGSPARSRTA